jgi:hypothetical protein
MEYDIIYDELTDSYSAYERSYDDYINDGHDESSLTINDEDDLPW